MYKFVVMVDLEGGFFVEWDKSVLFVFQVKCNGFNIIGQVQEVLFCDSIDFGIDRIWGKGGQLECFEGSLLMEFQLEWIFI